MIKDYKGTADHISNWMKKYSAKAGTDAFVLGLSGGIDSALCAFLALRTGLKVTCCNLPCHSSPSAYNRAKAFADEIGLPLLKVDLSNAFESISGQLSGQADYDWTSKGSAGGLRSCLRAPTLSFLAHATNGLIIGTGNRSEDHITRYYQKFGDGCVDFSPIADLWKSEVNDLFRWLAEEKTGVMGPGAQAIHSAKPSADLWGADSGQEDEKELGISYDEIEWADREDMNAHYRSIIFSLDAPETHPQWVGYTQRQKDVINKLYHMEKTSQHKMNPNMPICRLHGATNLVG